MKKKVLEALTAAGYCLKGNTIPFGATYMKFVKIQNGVLCIYCSDNPAYMELYPSSYNIIRANDNQRVTLEGIADIVLRTWAKSHRNR